MSGILISTVAGRTVAPTPTVIGEPWGGGYYAGQISTTGDGVATHYLIVAPVASGQSIKKWKTTQTSTPGTSSVIDGPTNSANMNDTSHSAAYFCKGLTIGSYTDWYMPAKNELEVCYYNLKPNTTTNDTSSGINANAVPSRSNNYTSGTPGQTSANDFKSGGSEVFSIPARYWSSTEYSAAYPWQQNFDGGAQTNSNDPKTNFASVRAVRRIPV